MRCLTLAQALRDMGAKCHFICREHAGNLLDLIRQRGFEAQALPTHVVLREKLVQQDAIGENILAHAAWLGADWQTDAEQTKNAIGDVVVDWLIVDHYALDVRWEAALKPHYQKLMVIDDLADRQHGCDLLLDQNLGRTDQHYADLVPTHCKVLVGPQYALLRPEFSELRQYSLARRGTPQLKHLLITMGGVDKDNVMGQVLAALTGCALPTDCRITVVMGQHAPWLTQVRKQAEQMLWTTEVLVNVDNMAKLMAESDLAIGAAGSTSWERCCLGLPTLVIVLAQNQYQGAIALSQYGCALAIEQISEIKKKLMSAIQELILASKMLELSRAGAGTTAGQGAKRIVGLMEVVNEDKFIARLVTARDESLLLEWANDPVTRANSYNSCPIDNEQHHSWFLSRLESSNYCLIYVVENSIGQALGQVRFEINIHGQWETGYSVDPLFRGLGLGKNLLRTALAAFHAKHANAVVIGKVKASNVPSCKVFESLNFENVGNSKSGTLIYRKGHFSPASLP